MRVKAASHIASHICVIAKRHILNLRKGNIGAAFSKRGRKYIESTKPISGDFKVLSKAVRKCSLLT